MRCLHHSATDPAFNLALEEWLLRHSPEDVFMLWRNAPAIIVGRHQNTRAQINEEFVAARGLPVIRRLTGGGAVFHDLGNVNFTFIRVGEAADALDFHRFMLPMVEALASLGVTCAFEGRNDLTINGLKISGNAQHVSGDRVLHHGTLLFAARMEDLSGALRVDPAKYQGRGVESVRRRVTNIADHLPKPMDVSAFMTQIMAHVAGAAGGKERGLSPEELAGAEALRRDKYATWEWNYGRSPGYALVRNRRTAGGVVEAHLDVVQGEVRGVRLLGEFFGLEDVAGLEARLVGCRHQREALRQRLEGVDLERYLRGVGLDELLECLV